MGKYSTSPALVSGTPATATGGDLIAQRMEEFYSQYFYTNQANGGGIATAFSDYSREKGVYVFPRFIQPGELYGEGWLYTANNTKQIFESTSAAGLGASPTCELITDEVYPVGPVDAALTDI
jgi:hypothetical protein